MSGIILTTEADSVSVNGEEFSSATFGGVTYLDYDEAKVQAWIEHNRLQWILKSVANRLQKSIRKGSKRILLSHEELAKLLELAMKPPKQ